MDRVVVIRQNNKGPIKSKAVHSTFAERFHKGWGMVCIGKIARLFCSAQDSEISQMVLDQKLLQQDKEGTKNEMNEEERFRSSPLGNIRNNGIKVTWNLRG